MYKGMLLPLDTAPWGWMRTVSRRIRKLLRTSTSTLDRSCPYCRLRPGIQPKLEALRALYEGKKIIVGRDKLDVVKGVVQKVRRIRLGDRYRIDNFSIQLRAFEKLLQDYPQWIGNVVLIQVTSPALSDSPKLERQVSELVAHINGEYGSLDFIPVHH